MLLILLAQAAGYQLDRVGPPVLKLCDSNDRKSDEIVVCAPREKSRNPYRLTLPSAEQRRFGKAEMALGDGVIASAETESVDVGGFPSKRAMVRIKIGF